MLATQHLVQVHPEVKNSGRPLNMRIKMTLERGCELTRRDPRSSCAARNSARSWSRASFAASAAALAATAASLRTYQA